MLSEIAFAEQKWWHIYGDTTGRSDYSSACVVIAAARSGLHERAEIDHFLQGSSQHAAANDVKHSSQLVRATEQSSAFLDGGEMLAGAVREGIRFCKQKHQIFQCPPYPASAHHRSLSALQA